MTGLPMGWYPSPTVAGHDQWWTGSTWLARTRLSDPLAEAPRDVPPPPRPPGVAVLVSPVALIALLAAIVSTFFNVIFVFSFIALVTASISLFIERRSGRSVPRRVSITVSLVAITLAIVGAVAYLIPLLAA